MEDLYQTELSNKKNKKIWNYILLVGQLFAIYSQFTMIIVCFFIKTQWKCKNYYL